MTLEEARRVTDLIATADAAGEIAQIFKNQPKGEQGKYILIERFLARTAIGGVTGGHWPGFTIPRDLCAEMLEWLRERALKEIGGVNR